MHDTRIFVTRDTGETLAWDAYALHGRGMPDGYREATDAERAAFLKYESLERRIEALEARFAPLCPGEDPDDYAMGVP